MNKKSTDKPVYEQFLGAAFMSGTKTTEEMVNSYIQSKMYNEIDKSSTVPVTIRLDSQIVYLLDLYADRLEIKRPELLKAIISTGVFETGRTLAKNNYLDDLIKGVPDQMEEFFNKKFKEESGISDD